jgi:hypothetical protein
MAGDSDSDKPAIIITYLNFSHQQMTVVYGGLAVYMASNCEIMPIKIGFIFSAELPSSNG